MVCGWQLLGSGRDLRHIAQAVHSIILSGTWEVYVQALHSQNFRTALKGCSGCSNGCSAPQYTGIRCSPHSASTRRTLVAACRAVCVVMICGNVILVCGGRTTLPCTVLMPTTSTSGWASANIMAVCVVGCRTNHYPTAHHVWDATHPVHRQHQRRSRSRACAL